MELQQLKYFKVVAETGKLTEAAQILYISPPALSTSISRLEKDLGVPLFHRTNSGIRLNHQGQIFLKYVNQALNALECAREDIQESLREDTQHIRIACNTTTQWADLIAAFSTAHPHIAVSCADVGHQQLINGLFSGGCDFLLATESEIPASTAENLDHADLFFDRIMAVVHPDHPIAKKKNVSPAELMEQTLFLPMPSYPLRDQLVGLFSGSGYTLPRDNAYSYIMTQRMATEGVGVAFSTEQMQKTLPFPVCFIPVTGSDPTLLCRIYWRKESVFTPEQQCFLDFTKEYYKAPG